MTPREFIEGLATVTGLDAAELRTVDKSISDAGMRGKNVGRAIHEVTVIEGLRVLLGSLGAKRKLYASEYVDRIESSKLAYHLDSEDVQQGGGESSQGFEDLVARAQSGAQLIDVLSSVCAQLVSDRPSLLSGNNISLELRLEVDTRGRVTLSQVDAWWRRCGLLVWEIDRDLAKGTGDAQQLGRVTHQTLAWIGQNTVKG